MKYLSLLGVAALLMLLLLATGCERKVVYENKQSSELTSCFTCHDDTQANIIQAQGEWANSIHASGNNIDYTNRQGATCPRCHQHSGFLEYIETGQINPPYEFVSAIHCFTCHAPHTNGNLALRTESPVTLTNNVVFDHGAANLCANCHQAFANTIQDTTIIRDARGFGPHHGPQSDLLQGTDGYEYADYTYEQSPHAELVTDGCKGCHMGNPITHDGYKIGGHSLNMVDEATGSTLVGVCTPCHTTLTDFDKDSAQTKTVANLDTLKGLLVDAGVLNGAKDLPNVPTGDSLVITDKNIAGALWNYMIVEADRSEGVHNYLYISGLMESSIQYMRSVVPSKQRYDTAPVAAH